MNTQKIISYLGANDISYDRKFIHAKNEGTITELSGVFNNAFLKLEEYVAYGLNNEFTAEVKEAITTLTKTIVEICEEKSGKNLAKFISKIDEIDRKVAKSMKNDNRNNVSVKTKVMEYINTYSLSLTASIKDVNFPRKEILIQSEAKLNLLAEKVESQDICCTTEVLEVGGKIIECLKKWAKDVSMKMHSVRSVSLLDDAISQTEKWNVLTKGVEVKKGLFTRKSNLITDVSKLNLEQDSFTNVSKGVVSLSEINMFKENLDVYKRSLEQGRFSTSADEEELEKLKQKKQKLLLEQEENYQNDEKGLIDNSTFVRNYERITERIAECDEDIETIDKNIAVTEKRSKVYRKLIRKLELINKILISFSDDPYVLNYFVERIDFEKVNNVLRGYGTEEDMANILELKILTESFEKHAQERLQSFLAEYEKQEKAFELQTDTVRKSAEEIKKQAEETNQKADAIRKQRELTLAKRNQSQSINQETAVTVDVVDNKPNSLTDIIDE